VNKTLLDTDILSEIFKAKNAALVSKAVAYKDAFGQFTISAITVMEIVKGLHKMAGRMPWQNFSTGCRQVRFSHLIRLVPGLPGAFSQTLNELVNRSAGRTL